MTPVQQPYVVMVVRGLVGGSEVPSIVYREGFGDHSAAIEAAEQAMRRTFPDVAEPSAALLFRVRYGIGSDGGVVSLPRALTLIVARPSWARLAEALERDWSDYGEDALLAAWNECFAAQEATR